eukprot:366344-Chlamydomonas_euryale.AAC.6
MGACVLGVGETWELGACVLEVGETWEMGACVLGVGETWELGAWVLEVGETWELGANCTSAHHLWPSLPQTGPYRIFLAIGGALVGNISTCVGNVWHPHYDGHVEPRGVRTWPHFASMHDSMM